MSIPDSSLPQMPPGIGSHETIHQLTGGVQNATIFGPLRSQFRQHNYTPPGPVPTAPKRIACTSIRTVMRHNKPDRLIGYLVAKQMEYEPTQWDLSEPVKNCEIPPEGYKT